MNDYRLGGPVLVAGCLRSGKSLMAAILNKHRSIYIPFEQQPMYGQYRKWKYEVSHSSDSPEEIFLKLLAPVFKKKEFRTIEDPLRLAVRKTEMSWGQMYETYMLLQASVVKPGAQMWGDKSPLQAGVLRQTKKIFPASKIIYLYRDPRAMAAEMCRSEYTPTSNSILVNGYLVKQMLHLYDQEIYDKKLDVIRIQYEHLVSNPAAEVRKVCNFLNIDFSDHMILEADSEIIDAVGWHKDPCWTEIRTIPASETEHNSYLECYLREWVIKLGYQPRNITLFRIKSFLAKACVIPVALFQKSVNFIFSRKYKGYNYFLFKFKND